MEVIYVSVWDGGTEVRSKCNYDPEILNVTDIETNDIVGLEVLEKEFIELPDGTIIDRCNFTIDFDTD